MSIVGHNPAPSTPGNGVQRPSLVLRLLCMRSHVRKHPVYMPIDYLLHIAVFREPCSFMYLYTHVPSSTHATGKFYCMSVCLNHSSASWKNDSLHTQTLTSVRAGIAAVVIVAGMSVVRSSSNFVALDLGVPPKVYEVRNLMAQHDAVRM